MRPRTEKLPTVTAEQLTELRMPVFVLLGGRDVTLDARLIQQRFAQHVPQAQIQLDPLGRHYLGDRSQAIAQFLRRVFLANEKVNVWPLKKSTLWVV